MRKRLEGFLWGVATIASIFVIFVAYITSLGYLPITEVITHNTIYGSYVMWGTSDETRWYQLSHDGGQIVAKFDTLWEDVTSRFRLVKKTGTYLIDRDGATCQEIYFRTSIFRKAVRRCIKVNLPDEIQKILEEGRQKLGLSPLNALQIWIL